MISLHDQLLIYDFHFPVNGKQDFQKRIRLMNQAFLLSLDFVEVCMYMYMYNTYVQALVYTKFYIQLIIVSKKACFSRRTQ